MRDLKINFNILTSTLLLIIIIIYESKNIAANDTSTNLQTKIEILSKNAENGDTNSQYLLGKIALDNKKPPDYSEAIYWFEIAANLNHTDSQAMLGALLFAGQGKPQNYKQAAIWWLKAANSGNSNAKASIGALYMLGIGVRKNLIESYKWLTLAAVDGIKEAANQRDESLSMQMNAEQIREAQKRINNYLNKNK